MNLSFFSIDCSCSKGDQESTKFSIQNRDESKSCELFIRFIQTFK